MTILAEVNEHGSLYACGSVNWAIGAIFLSCLLIPMLTGFALGKLTNFFVGFVVMMLTVVIVTPIGWHLAAALAEGSCS